MVNADAELHKALGNKLFADHCYEEAIKEYSTAIIKDSTQPVYYTNRAVCHSKLHKYDQVINDSRKAIDLDDMAVKAYYFLGKALIEKKQHTEALTKLKIAYQLGSHQKVKYINDILQALLLARKRKWDDDEVVRLEKESELLRYVKKLVAKDYDQKLNDIGNNDPEIVEEIKYNMDEKLSAVQMVFEHSKENLTRREIPDAYLDKISFNVMHDPVFTPDGITYERQSLLDHFARNGHFDPITRKPCTEHQLVANLSLREAIEDFLKENGWAADY
ncbi:unnamed protein product [Cunninghamella blakesleeana]